LSVPVNDLTPLKVMSPALARVRELLIASDCDRFPGVAFPIPATLGDMSALEVLRLGEEGRNGCGEIFVTLPSSLVRLKRLKTLRADAAFGTHAPPDFIGDVSSLENLGLMRSNLREVPAFIRRLEHLKVLSLWMNDISVVPEFLADLPELEEIDLSSTRVHRLPAAFAKAPKLRRIKLGDNGLTAAEKEQLRHDFAKIAFDFQDTYGP
jgi:Leucine-rich repeat (LRR) protein